MKLWSLALAVLTLPAAAWSQETKTDLKAGDRIVFLGDSITAGGTGKTGFIGVIRSHLADKKPDLKVELIGAGISGNKVPDLQKRLDRDVLAKKPSVVVIYIGINDVWHFDTNPKVGGTKKEDFEAGLKEIAGKIKGAGARVVLCTPSVIGEKPGGANKLDGELDKYADISRKLAKDEKLTLCDLRQAFVDHLEKNNEAKKGSGILTTDGVHLNEAGNRLVAQTMLKSLGE